MTNNSMVFVFVLCSSAFIIEAISVSNYPQSAIFRDQVLLKEIFDIVYDFKNGVYEFWKTYGPDEELGGFYTTVNQYGQPKPGEPKNIVTQSRHLYVGAAVLLLGLYPEADKDKIAEIIHAQYDWIEAHFPIPGGGEFYYIVSSDGKTVVNGDVRMYYTEMAIWGLTQYSMAAKQLGDMDRAKRSLQLAMGAYQSLHNRLYDSQYGGYDQSRERNWFYFYGKEMSQSYDWSLGCKGFNSHLHALEALTSLYQASGDDFIRTQLIEMLYIYINILYKDRPFQPLVSYCDWTPLSYVDVNYGHDIETAHIMQDAGQALNFANVSKDVIDAKVIEIVQNVGTYAFDYENGGVYMAGVYNQGVTLYQKAFWVQAEASLGFWRAYLISGQRDYLEKMKATLIWYRDYHLSQLGEFYWYSDIYDSYRGLDLYGPWKASYHNMRCLLTMLDEIESYLQ